MSGSGFEYYNRKEWSIDSKGFHFRWLHATDGKWVKLYRVKGKFQFQSEHGNILTDVNVFKCPTCQHCKKFPKCDVFPRCSHCKTCSSWPNCIEHQKKSEPVKSEQATKVEDKKRKDSIIPDFLTSSIEEKKLTISVPSTPVRSSQALPFPKKSSSIIPDSPIIVDTKVKSPSNSIPHKTESSIASIDTKTTSTILSNTLFITKGDTGPTGEKGSDGIAIVGPTGPKGETGPTGEKGLQGKVGPTGPKGDVGLTGETGPQAEIGPTGPKGDIGPTGPQAEIGPTGATIIGPTGPPGTTIIGPTGDRGEMGPTGPTPQYPTAIIHMNNSFSRSGSTDVTTASQTYELLPDMSIYHNVTSSVLVMFSISGIVTSSQSKVSFRLFVDGIPYGNGTSCTSLTTMNTGSTQLITLVSGLIPGEHRFEIFWRTENRHVTARNNSGSESDFCNRTLILIV